MSGHGLKKRPKWKGGGANLRSIYSGNMSTHSFGAQNSHVRNKGDVCGRGGGAVFGFQRGN